MRICIAALALFLQLIGSPVFADGACNGQSLETCAIKLRQALGILRIERSDGEQFLCTAFFASKDVLVTAAHCLINTSNKDLDSTKFHFAPSVSSYPGDDWNGWIEAANPYVPEGCHQQNWAKTHCAGVDVDFGFLRLSRSVDEALVIPLSNARFPDGVYTIALPNTGLQLGYPGGETFMAVQICEILLKRRDPFGSGSNRANFNTCGDDQFNAHGLSGGPAIILEDNGKPSIIGISSRGSEYGAMTTPFFVFGPELRHYLNK